MTIAEIAVACAIVYFAGFGLAFVFRPELVEQFGLRWERPAGRTEVRCYYGAVSVALSAFLAYLWSNDLAREAATGVLFLASAVLLTRIAGTIVDRGVDDPYTRVAIPVETVFVFAMALVVAAS